METTFPKSEYRLHVFLERYTIFILEVNMAKVKPALKELLPIWYGSKKIKRCVLCKAHEHDLDEECPVCRAIKLLKGAK